MIEALGTLVLLAGALFTVIGGIWFVVNAFRESLLWGIGVLVFPFASLLFLILEWQSAKRPFGLQIFGVVLILFAALVLAVDVPGVHTHYHHHTW